MVLQNFSCCTEDDIDNFTVETAKLVYFVNSELAVVPNPFMFSRLKSTFEPVPSLLGIGDKYSLFVANSSSPKRESILNPYGRSSFIFAETRGNV